MSHPPEFQAQWRERLASGSKLAARALGQALKDDDSRVALVAPLLHDPMPTVRISALRAFEEVAATRPRALAPHAQDLVQALGAEEPDAQTAALSSLTHVAPYAQAEVALALPLIAELLKARRPALREEAARCLGRLGAQIPDRAADVAAHLGGALAGTKSARAGPEAREILGALEGMILHLPAASREQLAAAVKPLRAHPSIQVRERAGRLSRQLAT